jgi:hypothetical protein
MLTRICLSLALLFTMPAWSQVEPDATGPPPDAADEMRTPPPVNGEAYPTATGAETRSNYLRAGFTLNTAYDDNVLGGGGAIPVADITYTIGPTIALDQVTSRLHQTFIYSPGFTLYQRTSALNGMDQNASANFQYRLSPHVAASLRDSFQKTTNIFNQPYGGVSGSTQSPTAAVVAPFADQLGNTASGELSYQFSRNGMIGGGGSSTMLNYPNPAQAAGLSNSNSRGGSAFYNLRLSSAQYIGVTYQYSRMTSNSAIGDSETQMHTIYSFYTLYLKRTLSLSVSGGPQHFDVAQSPLPASGSWTPSVTASVAWQSSRTNFAASYSRTVTGAGGLLGAFQSNNAGASGRWQLARTWTVGSAASYAIQKNVLPTFFSSNPGGHTVSGNVSVQHPISERFTAELGYTRLHQSYGGIAVISKNPDSDREYISISYQFARPLGR